MRSDAHAWRRVALGDVCHKIGSGATPRGGEAAYTPAGVALIRSKNVLDMHFSTDGLARIPDEAADALQGVSVEAGDVLLNITGQSVARCCKAPKTVLPARVNQHVAIVRPNTEQLDSGFLQYALVANKARLLALASAGATREALTKAMISEFEIKLPVIEEQRQISAVISSLDEKIENNRRIAKALEEIAATLFKARFVDFVDRDDLAESEIGPIPSGWQTIPMSDAITINPRVPAVKKGSVVPYVGMSDVPSWGVRPDGIGSRGYSGGARFEPSDTLMARITGCIEHGKGAFVDFLEDPGAGSTEFLVFRAKPPLTPEMVFLLSRTSRVREHAIANMSGSSGRQRVQTSAFDHLPIAVPPGPETLAEEASVFRMIFQHTRALWRENHTLVHMRDALLPRLISGQILVSPNAELVSRDR